MLARPVSRFTLNETTTFYVLRNTLGAPAPARRARTPLTREQTTCIAATAARRR
jgi:hypothetical protein